MTVLVFGGPQFYPDGGIEDLIGAAPTWGAAYDLAKSRDIEWWELVDLENARFARGGDNLVTKNDNGEVAALRGLRMGPIGHVAVPWEPTQDMLKVIVDAGVGNYGLARDVWLKILDAVG
jgi:hypothetical protein